MAASSNASALFARSTGSTRTLQRLRPFWNDHKSPVEGTLIGFRFPAWARGINAPGYHFHFVDRSRQRGGHVLDIAGRSLQVQVDTSRAVTVMTPDDPLFDNMDFDNSGESIQYRRALRPDAKEERP